MASNTIQDSLLETMNIIAKANDNKNVQTITIEAVIESVVDVEKGIYTANYLNNKIQVYSAGSTYKEKQQVYVLVPNGDFTKKKIIISAIDDEPRDTTEQGNKEFVFASNNIIADGDMPYSLCSYKNNSFTWEALKAINSNLLYSYSKKQKTYKLGCHIRTSLPSEQIIKRGYYYLKFSYSIMIGGESMPQEVILDINNILGNPYQLNTWTEQGIIFSIPEDAEIDKNIIPTLTVGCLNFIQDDDETESDIFFKNFSLHALEDASAVKGYFLYLTATDGFYMNPPQITSTTLIPELRYDGKKVDLKGAECFWFEKDTSITQESENYFAFGGNGWACLNLRKTEVDEKGKEYVIFESDNSFSKKITDSYIVSSKTYKCLIIKDNAKYSAEVEITQLNSTLDFTLEPDSKTYVKNSGNVKITARTDFALSAGEKLSFYWERSDKNKKYLDNNFFTVESNTGSTETIVFPTRKIDTVNYISCSLHSSIRGLIATKTVDISTTENLTYQIVIENADVTFKYDANGKSPLAGAGYVSGSATAAKIAPITFKVYKDNGDELTVSEYLECKVEWKFPKHKTLLKPVEKWNIETDDYYIYNGDPIKDEDDETNDDTSTEEDKAKAKMSLKYDIAALYNNNYTNNTIYLTVIFGDKKINEVIQPYFLMDGAMGTNGTKINTIIRYNGYAYNEVDEQGNDKRCRLYYIYDYNLDDYVLYNESGLRITADSIDLHFTLDVYEEGKKVSENGNWIEKNPEIEEDKCNWSLVEEIDNKGKNNTNGYMSLDSNNSPLGQIYHPISEDVSERLYYNTLIKAEIKYAGKIIVTYYPIDTIIIDDQTFTLEDALQLKIDNGFNCVLYNNAGYYPIYDKTPFVFHGPDFLKERNFYIYSESPHLYGENEDFGMHIELGQDFLFKAADSFFSSVGVPGAHVDTKRNYLRCYEIDGTHRWSYYKPIVIICNTYSLTSLNNWDGQKIQLNENESIYAPLVGAGVKNNNNTFSGFLMGDIQEKQNGEINRTPRFSAYNKGIRTFNIDADTGKVTIGAGGGQIIIDPNAKGEGKDTAVIRSGNYSTDDGIGMEIDFTDPHIYFGSGKFKVDSEGKVTMTEADVQGKIISEEGKIANFNIIKNYLYTGSSNADTNSGAVCLASDDFTRTIHNTSRRNLRFAIGSKFAVGSDGTVYAGDLVATGGSFKGDITGASGTFSGNLSGSTITGATIKNSSGTFSVDANGNIKGANITGSTFTGANNKFKVDDNGTVTCSDMHITDGTIKLGGLELTSSGLTSTKTTQFGPFKCDINSIFANARGSGHGWGGTNTPTVFMCTGSTGAGEADEGQTIAGVTKKGWCFGAGHRFGVDIDGNVYCSAIKISGEDNDTATSTIGKMSVFPGYLSISLGDSTGSGSNQYFMTLGSHNGYLLRIYSAGSSGENTVFGIMTNGTKVGF